MYSEKDIQKLGELKKTLFALKKKRISLGRTLEKLDEQIESIEGIVEDLSNIWIFYKGVPLRKQQCWESSTYHYIKNVPENDRYAEIYHNATAKPKEDVWGCDLRSYRDDLGPLREKWLGANFTLKAAQELACEWVANGMIKEKE